MSNKDKRVFRPFAREEGSALNVGYGNFIAAHRVIAILECGSLPVRRLREQAASRDQLLDATSGRKMRSIIVSDTNHIIISALAPQTLQDRLWGTPAQVTAAQLEINEGEFIS